MTLYPFKVDGHLKPSYAKNNFNSIFGITVQNHVRQLIDRSVNYGGDTKDLWGEAYIDSNGRNNSIDNSGETIPAIFSTNKYVPNVSDEASGDTTHDPDSFTNPENAFDGDDSTAATKSASSSSDVFEFGKTFSTKTIKKIRIKCSSSHNPSGGDSGEAKAILQTYNGSTWSDYTVLYDVNSSGGAVASGSYDSILDFDSSVDGIRIKFVYNIIAGFTSGSATVYSLAYGELTDSTINHNIPSGTFNSTTLSAFCKSLVADFEEGADIQYKLTNATEDSGWLNEGEISQFTQFTSEPTNLIIKLIPKSTSPTFGVPSVYGAGVLAL